MSQAQRRVAVIGGGITGLACAYHLSKAGCQVTVLEATDRLGGLGTYFEYEGLSLEKHYHVMLPSDEHLLPLLAELRLDGEVYWRDSELGFLHGESLYPLNGPMDLLRFRPVPFLDRLRLGLTALYASRVARPDPLDDITVVEWLTRCSGRRAFEKMWRPLLEAKFGDAYGAVPALWYWSRFNREKGTEKEVKGYIRGGYRRITEALAAALHSMGATIETGTPVDRLDLSGSVPGRGEPLLHVNGENLEFDHVVCTLPMVQTRQLAAGGLASSWLRNKSPDLDYQGVLNVLVMLRRSAFPYYWTAVMNQDVAFRGAVETTRCIDPSETGGRHLVYLLNYFHRNDPRFGKSDADLIDEYVGDLLRVAPHLNPSDVSDVRVFRAPYVEPLYTLGYNGRKPPHELVPGRVFLANTAQIYPDVTSWNSSVGVATRVARLVLGTQSTESLVEAA
jgi:protoporphyrinogen oxidase